MKISFHFEYPLPTYYELKPSSPVEEQSKLEVVRTNFIHEQSTPNTQQLVWYVQTSFTICKWWNRTPGPNDSGADTWYSLFVKTPLQIFFGTCDPGDVLHRGPTCQLGKKELKLKGQCVGLEPSTWLFGQQSWPLETSGFKCHVLGLSTYFP